MLRRAFANPAVLFLLLGLLATAVWVQRVHVARPVEQGLENVDVVQYFYPTAVFLHDELRRGNLPLWNPYQNAGGPFLALGLPGVLYPPHLILTALLRPARALEAGALFHIVIAGFFTWLFARRLGLGGMASVAAAVGYMLSGPVLTGIYNPVYLATQAWLPALLWSVHGLVSEARPRWALAVGSALALAFCAGWPQAFAYEVQFAAAYGVFALATLARAGRWRIAGLGVLAGLLAFGLAAPTLLPALAHAEVGYRSHAPLPYEIAQGAPWKASAFLAPLFGARGPEMGETAGPVLWAVSLPVLAVPLALFGLLARELRSHWAFFVASMVVVGLFMLGDQTPVFRLYYQLPGGDLFQGTMRISFLYVLLGALLAAMGIHGLCTWLGRRTGIPVVAGLVAGALLLVTLIDFYRRSELFHTHPILYAPIAGGPSEVVEAMRRAPGHDRLFVLENQSPPGHPTHLYKVGMMNGFSAVPDYEPNLPLDYASFYNAENRLWRGHVWFQRGYRWRYLPDLLRLLDLMSVRYYAVPARPAEQRELARLLGGEVPNAPGVIERASAVPRAYAVRRIRFAPDLASMYEPLLHGSFRPDEEAIVLGRASDWDSHLALLGGSEAPGRDQVEIRRLDTDVVVIDAECEAACLLVLTDLYYPGWRLTVNGSEREIHRVNALFRGVALDPGRHEVVYEYAPAPFRLGVGIFAITVAGIGGIGAAGVASRRRGRVEPGG